MKREKEILRQQLELLAEESKGTPFDSLPGLSNAMVAVSKELFKRKCFTFMFFVAVGYLLLRLTKHSKQFFRSR